jgi:hypothetical protein
MSEQDTVKTGTIVAILPTEDIKDGQYRKQVFAIKNNEGYEGKEAIFAFEIFEAADKDKIEKFRKYNKVGSFVDVSYEIRCNENGGRYFTSLSAWKVFKNEGQADVTAPAASFADPADEVLEEEPPF